MRRVVLCSVVLAVPAWAQSNELHFETETKGIGLWDFGYGPMYLGEVDGDGITDLVATTFSHFRVVKGTPTGEFAWAGSSLPFAGAFTHLLADLDGDGLSDWVHTDYHPAPGTVPVYVGVQLGNGTPGSWWGPATSYHVGSCPNRSAVGDLNKDGFLDIATSHGWDRGTGLNTLVNDGAGGFVQGHHFDSPTDMLDIACGDVTGDGFADVACQDRDATLYVFPSLGDGTLAPPWTSLPDAPSSSVAIADVDGDGLGEVLSGGPWGRVDVYSWVDGQGFTEHLTSVLEIQPSMSRTADFNGDGRADLAGTFVDDYPAAGIALGNGDGTFAKPYPLPAPGHLGVVADLSADGLPEMTLLVGEHHQSSIYRNLSRPSPWTTLGGGTSGASGTPSLETHGVLLPDTWTYLGLEGAPASAPGLLVIGSSTVDLPLFGGLLVPSPDLLVPITTDAIGELHLEGSWPDAIPAGTALIYQAWLLDPTGPEGLVSSNGVQGVTP